MNLPTLSVQHLLGIHELTAGDILTLFRVAAEMKSEWQQPDFEYAEVLRGQTIINLFVEDSTRTRNSFHLAESRLGASIINLTGGGSSLSKGETLLDTLRVIEAMGVDAIVLRHSAACAPHFLAERCSSIFINAGDGRHEHPTQALLDGFTLFERWGIDAATDAENVFNGKKVAIVGDITHGRVALSNILLLNKLGAQVVVCGPPTLIPRGIRSLNVEVSHSLEEVLNWADAINMLRMQHERQEMAYVPSISEYRRLFGLAHPRLREFRGTIPLILHPGPVNRGVELDSEVADSINSCILEQVTNGVAIRMSVLALLVGKSAKNIARQSNSDQTVVK